MSRDAKLYMPDDGSAGGAGLGSEPVTSSATPAPPAAVSPGEGEGSQPAPLPGSLIPPAGPPAAPAVGSLGDDWINEDGTFRQGWYQRFPDEMQIPLAKYKSVEDLAKGHANAQAMIGRKGVFIPNDKSTPEEVADFRKAVGVPETPDAYQIKPDKLPEGMQWSDDLAKPFLAVAHKHNVSQAALRELSVAFAQMESMKGTHMVQTAVAERARKYEEGRAELLALWKDDFGRNELKAQQAVALFGVPVDDFGLMSPKVVAGFVRAAGMLSEDKLIAATGGLNPVKSGPALADDIQKNPDNPRYKLYQEGDPDTVALVRSYRAQAKK